MIIFNDSIIQKTHQTLFGLMGFLFDKIVNTSLQ